VLEKGKVIECGTHEELIEQDGHYRVLFEMQFNSFDDEIDEV
jgi:ABC-type multidrug transport system fused ATPase/permease subunit